MAKSDYTCKKCKKVKSAGLIQVLSFKKYSCPSCGVLCGDCVSGGIFSTTCKKCGSKVMKYEWVDNKWKQI